MRKGVKLAGLLAVGVAAFAVACSPVCNPVPVADPHGTPEQQWNWWRETYATADYGQADLAGYTSLSDIPQCGMEDGSTAGGYERICEWLGEWFRGVRAARMGYLNWLYVQCSGGCMIPVDMLDWNEDWID